MFYMRDMGAHVNKNNSNLTNLGVIMENLGSKCTFFLGGALSKNTG